MVLATFTLQLQIQAVRSAPVSSITIMSSTLHIIIHTGMITPLLVEPTISMVLTSMVITRHILRMITVHTAMDSTLLMFHTYAQSDIRQPLTALRRTFSIRLKALRRTVGSSSRRFTV